MRRVPPSRSAALEVHDYLPPPQSAPRHEHIQVVTADHPEWPEGAEDGALINRERPVHFYRDLRAWGELPPRPAAHEFRSLFFVGYAGTSAQAPLVCKDGRPVLEAHGLTPYGRDDGPGYLAAASGCSALVVLGHGKAGGVIEAQVPLRAQDWLERLRENRTLGVPLRFLLIYACNQHEAYREVLRAAAQEQLLHPDFAAVLLHGEPREDAAGAFLRAMLEANAAREPFLQAVHRGRLDLWDHGITEMARPVVYAFHPFPNPLPIPEEQEEERYFWALAEAADPQWLAEVSGPR